MKNTTVELKDNELEAVAGGNVPELPATQLAHNTYKGMFSNAAITETTQDEKSTANIVSFFPGLDGFP